MLASVVVWYVRQRKHSRARHGTAQHDTAWHRRASQETARNRTALRCVVELAERSGAGVLFYDFSSLGVTCGKIKTTSAPTY